MKSISSALNAAVGGKKLLAFEADCAGEKKTCGCPLLSSDVKVAKSFSRDENRAKSDGPA